jgi:N-acetylglucosaminyldiphosphoundecaprenol N-acetyl-beta-D-mannosaminyltransferase
MDVEIVREKVILNLRGYITKDSLDVFYPLEQEVLQVSPHILVNLALVEFLDSSAIGQLLELGNQVRLAGGQLSLAAVPHRILRILKVLRMENLFPIYPEPEAYLSAETTKASATVAATQFPSPADGRIWTVIKGPRVLDASTSQYLLDAGVSTLADNPFLICDLSGTVFLASAGLATLASLRKMSMNLHGEFRVVICANDTLRVIKLARFDQVLSVYRNFSQAVV